MSGPTRPEPRIGDAEREAAVSALGEHYAAGRLTREEHDERSGRALSARTESELWPLFADLPPLRGAAPGPRPNPASAVTGATRAATSRGSRSWGVPWPLRAALVVVLALVVVTHLPLLLLLLLGVWLWSRAAGRGRCRSGPGHRHGSWQRDDRWSGRVR